MAVLSSFHVIKKVFVKQWLFPKESPEVLVERILEGRLFCYLEFGLVVVFYNFCKCGSECLVSGRQVSPWSLLNFHSVYTHRNLIPALQVGVARVSVVRLDL